MYDFRYLFALSAAAFSLVSCGISTGTGNNTFELGTNGVVDSNEVSGTEESAALPWTYPNPMDNGVATDDSNFLIPYPDETTYSMSLSPSYVPPTNADWKDPNNQNVPVNYVVDNNNQILGTIVIEDTAWAVIRTYRGYFVGFNLTTGRVMSYMHSEIQYGVSNYQANLGSNMSSMHIYIDDNNDPQTNIYYTYKVLDRVFVPPDYDTVMGYALSNWTYMEATNNQATGGTYYGYLVTNKDPAFAPDTYQSSITAFMYKSGPDTANPTVWTAVTPNVTNDLTIIPEGKSPPLVIFSRGLAGLPTTITPPLRKIAGGAPPTDTGYN